MKVRVMSVICSDKRDILDLVKLSYIIVRTGLGSGHIQVGKLNPVGPLDTEELAAAVLLYVLSIEIPTSIF